MSKIPISGTPVRILAGMTLLCAVAALAAGNIHAQASPPTDHAEKPWKDYPRGVEVTRWPEQSPIRPITYAEWKAKQPAVEPFRTILVEKRVPDIRLKSDGDVGIIINAVLYSQIQAALGQYLSDLAVDGYTPAVYTVSGGTAPELRSFLRDLHEDGMDGAVLIGDLPTAWFETVCWDPPEDEQFPCDLYYMDLDGTWTDNDSDGLYDLHRDEINPEIWFGRLTASPLTMTGKTEAELLQHYFFKNHLYRTGSLPVNDQALVYVDDDWSEGSWWESEIVGAVYPDRLLVADDTVTVAADYAARLTQYYELIEIWVHSDPMTHHFKIPPGVWHTTLGVGEMVSIDPPGVFYNLFACSNARYVEDNYMAGWYIFHPSGGLAAVGSTKTGSMLFFDYFMNPIASGRTYGEAFLDWVAFITSDGVEDWEKCWFYGMSFCGDPTLLPHLSSCPRIIAHGETDTEYGDGDGFYEPGETVAFTVTVTNNGAKPARDVSVTLSTDDGSLVISQREIIFGDIAKGVTMTNTSSPFLVTIPTEYTGRTDSFFLDLRWNDGAGKDQVAFTLPIGNIPILLVDDDNGGNREKFYTEYLDKQRIPCTHWVCPPVPTTSDLQKYDIVIWYTGDYRAEPLDASKIDAIKGYLDGGGQMLLTGQAIAAQLSTLDPTFLSDYLKAQYLSTKNIPILPSLPGATLFLPEDTAVIAGYGGAGNQSKEDQITATGGGIPELQYYGDPGLGCVSWWGSYNLVFMSFGFEGMINYDQRWVWRDTIYERMLDLFACPRPNALLTVTVTPGTWMNLVEHTPTIAWTFTNGQPYPQQAYQVQVGIDNDWATAEMWDSGPVTSAATEVVYGGAPLIDGQTYYIRVQVSDGATWSNWHHRRIRMNTPPGLPTDLNPRNDAALPLDAPDLTHTAVADADGDLVSYSYEVYADQSMTTLAATADGIMAGLGGTVLCRLQAELIAGQHYYWRVRSDDGTEPGDWTGLASCIATGQPQFICGDANGDGLVNVGDAVFVIGYVFRGGPAPSPLEAGDANGDGTINVGDAVYLITYIFRGGPAPICP